jgi:hypothetical protein
VKSEGGNRNGRGTWLLANEINARAHVESGIVTQAHVLAWHRAQSASMRASPSWPRSCSLQVGIDLADVQDAARSLGLLDWPVVPGASR